MSAPDQPPPPTSASAGQRLSAARKDWGLSVDEVATYLNLGPATITALEQDAYDRLPGSTFIKGYLRAYAKLLKLDHENIIDHTTLQPEAPNEIPVTPASLRSPKYYARAKKRKSRLTRILIAILLLLTATWLTLTQLPPTPNLTEILKTLKLSTPVEDDGKSVGIPFSPGSGGGEE